MVEKKRLWVESAKGEVARWAHNSAAGGLRVQSAVGGLPPLQIPKGCLWHGKEDPIG